MDPEPKNLVSSETPKTVCPPVEEKAKDLKVIIVPKVTIKSGTLAFVITRLCSKPIPDPINVQIKNIRYGGNKKDKLSTYPKYIP